MATGDPTNIGATEPPRLGRRLEPGMPVAERADRPRADGLPVAQVIQEPPLWISRWQNSATPAGRPRPWIRAYRFWRGRAAYEGGGPPRGSDWIDVMHQSGYKRRHIVPANSGLVEQLMQLTSSVGQWLHRELLVHGRNKYPGVTLVEKP